MKSFIKSLLPERALLAYHYALVAAAALYYGFPSRRMVVIGVTGTKGKTSAANFIWSVLHAAGIKAGLITTANIRMHEREMLNYYHMTMPGRFTTQKLLYQMAKSGCTHCVVETTSEGVKQHRHQGIAYDIAVFTNIFPEHLASHGGSFDTYRETKGKLFAALQGARKTLNGTKIAKAIIVNHDNPHWEYFYSFPADEKLTFGVGKGANVRAEHIDEQNGKTTFTVASARFDFQVLGAFNVMNALPAVAIGRVLHLSEEDIRRGLSTLPLIPGRMEPVNEGQNFLALVDYAHEGESMKTAIEAARALVAPAGWVIVLLGAEGGGRDKAKRPKMGDIAGRHADYAVVSTVDPYDDPHPLEILEDIARAAESSGKVRGENLFVVEDRREGIRKALSLARSGDMVLITGKGAEQSMIIGTRKIPWDDRLVVREELKVLLGPVR